MTWKPDGNQRRGRGWTWMLTLSNRDVEALREHFLKKGPLWDQWEYKLRGGKIIIYTPVVPRNPRTRKPDPALRYMAKHLRIRPVPQGPFSLEYRRHTEQWWPLMCKGDLKAIIDHIEAMSVCRPHGQGELEREAGRPAVRSDAR